MNVLSKHWTKWRRLRITTFCIVGLCVAPTLGCSGGTSKGGKGSVDDSIVITGTVSNRGSTPFSLLLFETNDGRMFYIAQAGPAEELRQLESMPLSATCRLLEEKLDDLPVVQVLHYDLMRLQTGERPLVGVVLVTTDGTVWFNEDAGPQWKLEGDFEALFRSFNGAKVWVIGDADKTIQTNRGQYRTLFVREYGIIRQ